MKMNRSGYYKWLNRPLSQRALDRLEITKLAKEIHAKHPSYGYHNIAGDIRDTTGWRISDNLVHKCCKMEGIRSKAKHYQWRKPKGEHEIYKNEISGDWMTTRPLSKVVSDMTVIYFHKIQYEWTFFLDVYNNSIVSWAVSPQRGDPAPYYKCRDQYLEKIKKEEVNGPIYFHTDQGTVYSSVAFNQAINDCNIIRSMSRAGTPTDNPVIESLNGWIKAQIQCDYNLNEWDSIEDFLEFYVEYFNHKRRSSKLKYKSPAQFTIEQGFQIAF